MALADASILVTGGTGSFGNKFAEIVLARYRPRRLVIFSRDELKQSEMRARFNGDSRLCVGAGVPLSATHATRAVRACLM